MKTKPVQHRPKDLLTEVHELRSAVQTAYVGFRIANQTRRQLALAFLKGVISTLGALAAVVIITPVIIWALQRISWPPLIGDVIARIILQYEQVNRQSPRGAVDQ